MRTLEDWWSEISPLPSAGGPRRPRVRRVHAGRPLGFGGEGRVLARLQHPNIAHLLDAGVEAAQPDLVLEYVRGEPIDKYCQRRDLGVEQRIGLFLHVLAAVAHAHSNLVVHRDLKPSNILVTEQGEVKALPDRA